MSNSNHYDIAIIGAGIVGLTLAATLANSPLKIVIVENHALKLDWPPKTTDGRVSAINRASQHIFMAADVWEAIRAWRISAYREMRIWDMTNSTIHFDSADIGECDLGHIIENRVIQSALFQKIQALPNLTLLCPTTIQQLNITEKYANLTLDNQAKITAKLVIGADGSRSRLRDLMGIENTRQDYNQIALVATVTTALPHGETAQQRFLATGPLAFLPLSDSHTASIVWSTTPEEANTLHQLDETSFRQVLANAFEHRLGAINSVSQRATFPLQRQHAKHYVQPRIALIGDAAHTIHPLAGQGLNLGLLDAACLSEVIQKALEARKDIGAYHVLRRYERWCRGHNATVIGLLEGLKYLFEQQSSSLAWLRRTGLSVVNQSSFLKNTLMRHAMGLSGDLPTLACGKLLL